MTIPETHSPSVPPAAPTPTPARGLAIAALVVGIIAFLTGLVPVLGIILAIAGLALGIVALVKKQPKALALTGTILAAVALIVSLISTLIAGAFTAAVIDVANETTRVTTETPADAADTTEADEEEAGEAGTRDNPLPLGTLISSKDWDVTIVSFTPNVNDQVAAANQFNPSPDAGQQYAMIEATAVYKGADEGISTFVGIDFVTSTGEVLSAWETFVSGMDPRFGTATLYEGGTDSGKLVFLVPEGAEGTFKVTPGLLADSVFVATS